MIKRTLNYNLSGDKNELCLEYIYEEHNHIEQIQKDYSIKDKSNGELYNEILDDLDGEFDSYVADIVEKLVDTIFKEVE